MIKIEVSFERKTNELIKIKDIGLAAKLFFSKPVTRADLIAQTNTEVA